MTVGAWLTACQPVAPPALAARVRSAIGSRWSADERDTAHVCESAAEEVLQLLLRGNETGRDSALDLLAADALVTYSFEYAASAGHDLEGQAGTAMKRIADLGARYAAAFGAS